MTDVALGKIRQNDKLADAWCRLAADPVETCFVVGTDERTMDTTEVDATIDSAAITIVAVGGGATSRARS